MKKIKVLQVIPALTLGGISSVVMNWYRHLDASKYQFDFISFNDGPLREEITALGGVIHIIPTIKQQPFQHLKALNKIISSEASYDVVHVHNSFKNGILLWFAKYRGVNVRVCHSHTGGVENKLLLPLMGLLKAIVTSASNVHLACGEKAGKFLYGNAPFKVINNAISVARYLVKSADNIAIKKQFSLPLDKKLVLHVGRFSVVKNHQFLLQLAQQNNLDSAIHFICVGEGPLKVSFAKQIQDANVQARFTLLSATPEIPHLLQIADGFIMPSLFEGISVALLEAQAAALPCLISDTIAKESDMGLALISFLALGEVSSWVEQLNQLRAIARSNEQITAAFFEKGFSTDGVLQQLTEIYQIREPVCQ